MTEIKFRAWIIPEKRIADVVGLCYESDGKIGVEVTKRGKKLTGSNTDVEYWWKDTEAGLLEYTGEVDSYGTDIYDGDIIKFHSENVVENNREHDVYMQIVRVGASFLQTANGMQPDIWYEWDEVRVVGNIYENKDLLEDVI